MMRMWTWARLGFAVLFVVGMVPLLPASAGDGAWVRVLPADGSYLDGGTIAVEVWVENVEQLYGADVRLAFDTAHLAVVDANPSAPGVQLVPRGDLMSPDFVIKNEADNQAGTIWYAATQLNPHEPVTGSGAIVAFTFQAQGVGPAVVDVQYRKLARRDGTEIPANAAGASYQIKESFRLYVPIVVRTYPSRGPSGSIGFPPR